MHQELKKRRRSSDRPFARWIESSKIHVAVDALGNPVRWLLSGGEVADITRDKALLEGMAPQAVLAGKGYDADDLLDYIQGNNAQAVIPPRSNRIVQCEYDRHLYKDRNLVERFFNRIKQLRRIATRYEIGGCQV